MIGAGPCQVILILTCFLFFSTSPALSQFLSEEEPDNELLIENGTELKSGLIVGTRVSTSLEFGESMALVGLLGGYAIEENFDVLFSLDYEAIHLPMSMHQRDRIFLGITSRRTFELGDGFYWRVGADYTHGADLNDETAFDYTSAEGNIVFLESFYLPGTADLRAGIGVFMRATRHAMPGNEGLVDMHDGVFTGLYIPFEISVRLLGHRLTLDKGLKFGYDTSTGGMRLSGAGRGPLHDLSR